MDFQGVAPVTASHRPTVECLEDRCVPVTWGNPWPDATQLTLSFAPDGTAVGDRSSNLLSVLNQAGTTAAWQREVLRAFQTWAVHANINIGLVADSGARFGTWGRPQGDARFGDIRLAGYGMSSEVIALSSPFETTAGTWSGDLKLNTRTPFSLGGGAGTVDLFTAFLHEAAHVLGLDHSEDAASAVYEHYLGPKGGLTAGDIASLQALYGARGADGYEGTGGN